MTGATFCLAVLGAAAPSLSAAPMTPVPLALAPIPDEALHGCRAAELEKALKSRLGRSKRFHLARDPGGATASLEIVECSRAERRAGEVTVKAGPVGGPTSGGGAGRGADRDFAMQTRTERLVVLRGRLASGQRFVQVSSGPKDRSLDQAVDRLRRAIDKALEDQGAWLLASPPP